jgi:ribosomal protein S18 acetylase RimI-like enzyme
VRISRSAAALARAQGSWIAALEPWRGLGYRADALGRYLARKARARSVWIARTAAKGPPLAIAVVDDGVLLGGFIALLAVRPASSGHGLGRALVEHVAARTFASRRWLYVSCDGNNAAALRFYRKLGFSRVGRLPDLVRQGRTEILLRKSAPSSIDTPAPNPGKKPGNQAGKKPGKRPGKQPGKKPGNKTPTAAVRVGYHQGGS